MVWPRQTPGGEGGGGGGEGGGGLTTGEGGGELVQTSPAASQVPQPMLQQPFDSYDVPIGLPHTQWPCAALRSHVQMFWPRQKMVPGENGGGGGAGGAGGHARPMSWQRPQPMLQQPLASYDVPIGEPQMQ